MSIAPYFNPADLKIAFESRFHFGWSTHGRQPTMTEHERIIEKQFHEVADRRNYHILEFDIRSHVMRALLSLAPETSPAEVTQYVKGNLATAVRKQRQVTNLWSRGWFVRSVGHVTNDVVRSYVDQQY